MGEAPGASWPLIVNAQRGLGKFLVIVTRRHDGVDVLWDGAGEVRVTQEPMKRR
jgi:hypothetical protein